MARVLLVHWKPEEAFDGLALLKGAGHEVHVFDTQGGIGLAKFKSNLPDVVVISLERLPSHGREVAAWFRSTKVTASTPLVFVGGVEEKVNLVQEAFPDAVFCTWRGVRGAVTKALRHPQSANPPARWSN